MGHFWLKRKGRLVKISYLILSSVVLFLLGVATPSKEEVVLAVLAMALAGTLISSLWIAVQFRPMSLLMFYIVGGIVGVLRPIPQQEVNNLIFWAAVGLEALTVAIGIGLVRIQKRASE